MIAKAAFAGILGAWKTSGTIYGDDATTPVGEIDGADIYEPFGDEFVIHTVDVTMAGMRVEVLEMIGPWDESKNAFITRAYGKDGSLEESTATVDIDGTVRFGSTGASAVLTPNVDTMSARWVRETESGEWVHWLDMNFQRLS
jgi:hypothetical protein